MVRVLAPHRLKKASVDENKSQSGMSTMRICFHSCQGSHPDCHTDLGDPMADALAKIRSGQVALRKAKVDDKKQSG